jgi:antitoxin MazE
MKIQIKKIGNSDGLILPKELMQRLDLKRGQQLHIVELAGGGFQALPYDPDFEKTNGSRRRGHGRIPGHARNSRQMSDCDRSAYALRRSRPSLPNAT